MTDDDHLTVNGMTEQAIRNSREMIWFLRAVGQPKELLGEKAYDGREGVLKGLQRICA